jgi:hypothetical protein
VRQVSDSVVMDEVIDRLLCVPVQM